MVFAGKDQERVRDVEGLKGAIEEDVFEEADAVVGVAADEVRGGGDLVELEEGGFGLVEFGLLPGCAGEIPGVVAGKVVVAPVGGVFDGAGAGDGRFKAGGLGDEPVGHVAAVAVAADSEVFAGSAMPAATRASTPARMSLTGSGDDFGHDAELEGVAVA